MGLSYQRIEKTLGGLKFAVVLILIFAAMMTIGTFLESYYGTEFANRVLYKRAPFMLVQFGMFISIFFAAFIRLPPKKRLYGFYTIHTGLIMIACGSFITWYAGIDGHILLHPNEPTRQIYLDQDVLKIQFPDEGLSAEKRLPYRAFSTTLNDTYEGLELGRYYPYAELTLAWVEPQQLSAAEENQPRHSSHYQLFNENVSEEIIMSLHAEAVQFDSSSTMGPLGLHYLPLGLFPCFTLGNPSALIIWDASTKRCTTPEQEGVEIQTTNSNNRFLVVELGGQLYSFFPEHSPYPLSPDYNSVLRNSPVRLFNRSLFEQDPHLFLFGRAMAYFDRDNQQWVGKEIDQAHSRHVELPWMGLQLALLRHEDDLIPRRLPEYTLPIQKNNELIRGRDRALEVLVQGKSFWVTNNEPLSLLVNGRKVEIYLTKETLTIPFEFALTEFVMDTDPGTNNPASFESYVQLFTSEGAQNHHIYMNNPLKYEGFTFYQASYSYNSNTNLYSSTLSANIDQGRFLKYLGSLFLVFGSAWHYQITRKKKNRKTHAPLIPGLGPEGGEDHEAS